MTAAQQAQADTAKQMFAVTPGDGTAPSLTSSRSEAAALAAKTNGSWARVAQMARETF